MSTNTIVSFIDIPDFVWPLIVRKTPEQSLADLLRTKKIGVLEALTFGYVNTPIQDDSDGEISGYLVYWLGGVATALYRVFDVCYLIGEEHADRSPDIQEALAIWLKYYECLDSALR